LAHHQQQCEFRSVSCLHCTSKVQFCQLKEHELKCPSFPIVCTQGCGETHQRRTIENHIQTECPNTTIACPFGNHGCVTFVKRKDIQSHMNSAMQEHLLLLLKKISILETQISCVAPPLTWNESSISKENPTFSLSNSNSIATSNPKFGMNPNIRATLPIGTQWNAFIVKLLPQIGDHISIGLATSALKPNNNKELGQQDPLYCGFNIGYQWHGDIFCNGNSVKKIPRHKMGDILKVEAHWMQNEIKFYCNTTCYTIPFTDLDKIKENLFPTLSTFEDQGAAVELIKYYHVDC